MRKHGWELPYHPLQVVAVAVFLALAFAYYVFFVPFVGKRVFQYLALGLYSPLVALVFSLYIWCAAKDPGDAGVYRSKKNRKFVGNEKSSAGNAEEVLPVSTEAITKVQSGDVKEDQSVKNGWKKMKGSCWVLAVGVLPCVCFCRAHSKTSGTEQASEDEILYCSLCEVEVSKHSKHCRVCDKCVDGFDHHCRWLNNCIGRKNYKGFFILMVSAFHLLILQWVIGITVLVSCFLNRSHFHVEIVTKLGSSFSLVPFVIVLSCCTLLALVATLPLGQLFFFHILLLKKGISTYDYIIAMREQQEQQIQEGQSPQMSIRSSATGMSSASSLNALHRGAWCTPPRLLFEDEFPIVEPEGSMTFIEAGNRAGKGIKCDRPRPKNNATVKINPWALARLDGEEVSKVAAEARKKSRILQPRERKLAEETDSSFDRNKDTIKGNIPRYHHKKRRSFRRERQQNAMHYTAPRSSRLGKLSLDSNTKTGDGRDNENGDDVVHPVAETSGDLGPLRIEARNAFCYARNTMKMPGGIMIISSSESSDLTSPDSNIQPFRNSVPRKPSSSVEPNCVARGVKRWGSASDGYEASAGESPDDSDQGQKPVWKNLLLDPSFNFSDNISTFDAQLKRTDTVASQSERSVCKEETSAGSSERIRVPQVPHSVEEIDLCLSEQESFERGAGGLTSSERFDQEYNF